MNLINLVTKKTIPILQWRIENVKYIIDNYIPFLFKKLETQYSSVLDYEITDVQGRISYDGFDASNLKVIKMKLKTLKESQDIRILLPVPNDSDVFVINGNHNILVNHIVDNSFYVQHGMIRSPRFIIFQDGLWHPMKGAQRKSKKDAMPLFFVFYTLGLLDKYFPEFKIHTDDSNFPDSTEYIITKIEEKNIWISYKKNSYNNKTPLSKIFTNSFRQFDYKPNKKEICKTKEVRKILEDHTIIDNYYEFYHGRSTLEELYDEIFEVYNKYAGYKDIHSDFKRVVYYEQIVHFLERKINEIRISFSKAKNLTMDINWKQKIPSNVITRPLKTYKYLQYVELNTPFKEIAYKTKIVKPIDNVPVELRDINETMFMKVCPVDTPDNKKCGVVETATSSLKLNEHGRLLPWTYPVKPEPVNIEFKKDKEEK